MELIKDYDYTIAYRPGKANVVADALSRKTSSKENKGRIVLLKELSGCKTILNLGSIENSIARFQVKPTLEKEIVKSQLEDPVSRKLAEKVRCKRRSNYAFRSDGALLEDRRLCVLNNKVR